MAFPGEAQLSGARRIRIATAWLLLALILLHALLPLGSPLARASGSAFSAATVEVSLAPPRGSEILEDARAAAPGDGEGGPGGPPAFLLLGMVRRRSPAHEAPDTRPRLPFRLRQPFDARAPPRR